MSGFLLGSTMGLMVGAGMMMSPTANRMRKGMMRKMRCAMRHMKHM